MISWTFIVSQTSNFGVPSAYDTPEASRGYRHGLHGLLAQPQTTPLTEVRLPMTPYSFFNQLHYRHYRISTAGRWRHHSCSFEKAACACACLVILSKLQQGSTESPSTWHQDPLYLFMALQEAHIWKWFWFTCQAVASQTPTCCLRSVESCIYLRECLVDPWLASPNFKSWKKSHRAYRNMEVICKLSTYPYLVL